MPANTSLADLTATQAIAMLCARDTTAAAYAQALFDRYDSGGFECLNAFISLNRSQVKHFRNLSRTAGVVVARLARSSFVAAHLCDPGSISEAYHWQLKQLFDAACRSWQRQLKWMLSMTVGSPSHLFVAFLWLSKTPLMLKATAPLQQLLDLDVSNTS